MGNLTAKTSGEIASFMTPAKTNIKSLKVHFSPKQLGTGDPSPENVREIEGWDGVEIAKSSVNLLDQSYITNASKWALSSDDNNTVFCGVPVYKGVISNFYQKFKSGYPFVGNPFKENVQYNVSAWLKTVNGNSLQGLKFGFKYTDGTTSLGGIFSANDTWKRQTVTSKANKTVSGIYCSYNSSGEIYLCGLAVCEKELDDISVVYPSSVNDISIDWSNDIDTVYGGYVDLISGELVQDMRYKQITADALSNAGDSIGYTSSVTALNGQSAVWIRNLFNSTAKGRKSGGIKANCNAFKVLMNSTGVISSQNRTAFAVDSETITSVADFISTVETLEQNGNGLYLAYELATPITHQLTPIQLKSFVGQNNFWSNADYVEIEYELKETEDIQKARKKIILNQPQLKTISDKIVSFNTDMVAPIKNCKIYFKPIQLGSGNPSPTNVRDINGWTGLDSYVNGNKINVDWTSDVGTVYGGYLDLAKGEVVAEYESISDTWGNWGTLYDQGDGTELRYKKFSNNIIGDSAGLNNSYCNIAKYNYNNNNGTIHFYIVSTSKNCRIYLPSGTDTSLQIQAVAKLKTPIHYPLSSLTLQQLLTTKSTNHIWSETNGQQIDVKYWTHKNLTPIPLTNYLENQIWTDSAYISSSGKKTTNTVSASHFLTNQILLEAGTYVLSGFSYYAGSDSTRYRIHAYDSTGKWLRQITFQQIDNLSPVDISFTLDTDTYVNVSIAMDFDGVLAKIN